MNIFIQYLYLFFDSDKADTSLSWLAVFYSHPDDVVLFSYQSSSIFLRPAFPHCVQHWGILKQFIDDPQHWTPLGILEKNEKCWNLVVRCWDVRTRDTEGQVRSGLLPSLSYNLVTVRCQSRASNETAIALIHELEIRRKLPLGKTLEQNWETKEEFLCWV